MGKTNYIAVALSAIALCLSFYNFYRSRKDARAANIRTIQRKQFEYLAIMTQVVASKLRTETALETVFFDASVAGNADLVNEITEKIKRFDESYRRTRQMEQDNKPQEPLKGSPEELLAAETRVGNAERVKALAEEVELREMQFIAYARGKMLLLKSLADLRATKISTTQ